MYGEEETRRHAQYTITTWPALGTFCTWFSNLCSSVFLSCSCSALAVELPHVFNNAWCAAWTASLEASSRAPARLPPDRLPPTPPPFAVLERILGFLGALRRTLIVSSCQAHCIRSSVKVKSSTSPSSYCELENGSCLVD